MTGYFTEVKIHDLALIELRSGHVDKLPFSSARSSAQHSQVSLDEKLQKIHIYNKDSPTQAPASLEEASRCREATRL